MNTAFLFVAVLCFTIWQVSGEDKTKEKGQVICNHSPCDPEVTNTTGSTSGTSLRGDQGKKSSSDEDAKTNRTNVKLEDQKKNENKTEIKLEQQKKENDTDFKLNEQKRENVTNIRLDDQKKENGTELKLSKQIKENGTELMMNEQKKENGTNFKFDERKKENETDFTKLPEFYKLLLTSTERVFVE